MMHQNPLQRVRDLYTQRHDPEALGMLAALLWRGMLAASLCAAVGLLLYAFAVFGKVTGTLANATNAATKQTFTLDQKTLAVVVQKIQARQSAITITATSTASSSQSLTQ